MDAIELEVNRNEFIYDTLSVGSESKKIEDNVDKKPPSLTAKSKAKAATSKKPANMRKAESTGGGKGRGKKAEATIPMVLNRESERVSLPKPKVMPEEDTETPDGVFIRSDPSESNTPPHSATPSPLDFSQFANEEIMNEKRVMPALSSAFNESIEVDSSDRGVVEV